MTIINYEELEKPIKEIEEVMEDYDAEETNLILNKIVQRRKAEQLNQMQRESANKAMEGLNVKNLYKKILKGEKGEDQD